MNSTYTSVPVAKDFNKELLMRLLGTGNIAPAEENKLHLLWDRWGGSLTAAVIEDLSDARLLVWLGRDVELDVERSFSIMPEEGRRLHVMAVALIMSSAASLIPELSEICCAPVPEPSASVKSATCKLGLCYDKEHVLARRYSLLTHYPFQGGCEVCWISERCPKDACMGNASSESAA
jgi:hypothetical protein